MLKLPLRSRVGSVSIVLLIWFVIIAIIEVGPRICCIFASSMPKDLNLATIARYVGDVGPSYAAMNQLASFVTESIP